MTLKVDVLVQVRHTRRIPPCFGTGPIRLPGTAGIIEERFLIRAMFMAAAL
jgi:hypothetical protein